MKALIVDDDKEARAALKELIEKHYVYLFRDIKSVASISAGVRALNTDFFGICFVGVVVSKRTGLDLLPHVPTKTKVVFLNSPQQKGIRVSKNRDFDYLNKPVKLADLKKCINRFEVESAGAASKERFLLIKEHGETIPIAHSKIEYIEGNGAYSIIHLLGDKNYTTAKTLKTLETLMGFEFIRIHKSYLVNKTMIHSFRKESLTTINGTSLPVSRIGIKELYRHF